MSEKLEEAPKKAGVSIERRVFEGLIHELSDTASVDRKANEAQTYAGERLKQAFGS